MSFTLDLRKACEAMKGNTDKVVGTILLDVGASLVQRSPVGDALAWKNPPPAGYVGGRFKGNWQMGFNRITSGDLPDIDSSGGVSMARIESGVAGNPKDGIHYYTNNLPYAQRLEDGYSRTQAPNGIVELTVLEFGGIVRRAQA
jgi:hypothetical protein